MSEELPRILVVTGNNFNLVTGGGITLTNLFTGWPADRIANLHEDATPVDRSVCRNFYRLSDDEIRWVRPFSLFRKWYGRVKPQAAQAEGGINPPSSVPAGPWFDVVKRIVGDSIPKRARLTARLTAWIDEFRPTLIYGFLGSMEQIDLTRLLARRWNIPLVVHIMDDWPSVLHTRGLLGPIIGPIIRRDLKSVLSEAAARLAICEEMCDEYRQRYGLTFLPFQNALDTKRWLPSSRTDWKAASPFVLRYVGSIVPNGQRESLNDIAGAVAKLSQEGTAIQLWIHSPRHESAYLKSVASGAIHIEGPPDPRSIASLLAGTDLLVLPYNFDPRSARYIRLSLPTKAPAYMISGTPVLVYAPGNVATARYAAREGWGYVVSAGGENGVIAAVRTLMKDESLREKLGRRAQAVAQTRHDVSVVRSAFWQTLREASQKGPASNRTRV